MKTKYALILDMDGVVVDNYRYHKKAWQIFCERHHIDFSEVFRSGIFGGTNKDHLNAFFGRALSDKEIRKYEIEKEKIYRDLYAPDIIPVAGLRDFLKAAASKQILLALATSSPPVNVDFVLNHTGLREYFHCVLDASYVNKGKPDPEIFLKTADALGIDPEKCIVFEDSVNGIRAAKSAGMKVVALATTHSSSELPEVDLVIDDFTSLNIRRIENLL